MNILILFLCLLMGLVMTFHAAMNARIGTLTGDPIFTNMVFWILGTVVAVSSYFLRSGRVRLETALAVPTWLYGAGIIGVFVSLGIVYLIPRAGVANFTVLILAGQLICSAVLSSTGFLSDAVHPIGPLKIFGFVLVFIGSYFVVFR